MGCDIHIIAEVKKDGAWTPNTKEIFPSGWKDGKMETFPDDCRHYDWFSILANVRNGYGFAGVETGQGFKIISEPKGVPEDASHEWLKTVVKWGSDMHSTSYLTLDDFDGFDWNQVSMKTGVISFDQYKTLKGTNNPPEGWCGSVAGGSNITISESEADAHLIKSNQEFEGMTINVRYHWSVIYRDWFADKIKTVIEPMRELSKEYPEGVRFCFGFDN